MNAARRLRDAPARWWLLLRTALRPNIAISSLRIALAVGLVLNAVNQGGALWDGKPISFGHVLMNFLVPFCVSGYSAAKNELSQRREPGAGRGCADD